jgi:hypothetical protein
VGALPPIALSPLGETGKGERSLLNYFSAERGKVKEGGYPIPWQAKGFDSLELAKDVLQANSCLHVELPTPRLRQRSMVARSARHG